MWLQYVYETIASFSVLTLFTGDRRKYSPIKQMPLTLKVLFWNIWKTVRVSQQQINTFKDLTNSGVGKYCVKKQGIIIANVMIGLTIGTLANIRSRSLTAVLVVSRFCMRRKNASSLKRISDKSTRRSSPHSDILPHITEWLRHHHHRHHHHHHHHHSPCSK